jgi:hypothetical protein
MLIEMPLLRVDEENDHVVISLVIDNKHWGMLSEIKPVDQEKGKFLQDSIYNAISQMHLAEETKKENEATAAQRLADVLGQEPGGTVDEVLGDKILNQEE